MDYELEVFEIYDENDEQPSNKKHLKHTRKKCKQKTPVINIDNIIVENDINRSKTSVKSSDCNHRPISLRHSILNVFSKLVICNKQSRRYQTTVPDKSDSPCTSRSFHRSVTSYGEYINIL